jgi:beta-mannanase
MFYASIQKLQGLDSPSDSGGGVQHAQGLIKKYPNAQLQIGLYMVGALDDILAGRYDQNISRLAGWFKKNNKTTIYLRIGYEFDYLGNNYEPTSYAGAFRYIVQRLRREGVGNVFYVWHSCAGFVQGSRERWYPGDEVVDWVGLSFFDAYNKGNMGNIVKIAQAHNKPLMIAEATPRGRSVEQGEKTWNMWYARLFDFAKANDVKIICYINWNWEEIPMFKGQGWGNARIEDNDFIKQKWLERVVQKKM